MAKRRKKVKSTEWQVSDARAERCYPPTGFMAKYLKYIRKCNDAPIFYHLGSIMTAMIALSGDRDLKVIREDKRVIHVPIQIWAAVVGGSGDRKSAAMDPICRLVQMACPERLLSAAASAEAWHQELAQPSVHGVGLAQYDELSRLFDMRSRSFNAGFTGWLLNAWRGGPLTHRVVQEADQTKPKYPPIPRVRFNILGAIPQDVLAEKTGRDDWRNGLLPRFTLWPSERDGYLKLDGYDERIEAEFAEWLREICCDEADIYINSRVADIITEWCYENIEVWRRSYPDTIQSSLERLRDKGFVFAAMYALSDLEVPARTRLRVQPIHAERACTLLYTLKRSTMSLFELVGASMEVKVESEIIRFVKLHPWCEIKHIADHVGITRNRVIMMLRSLEDAGYMKTRKRPKANNGKRGKIPIQYRYVG